MIYFKVEGGNKMKKTKRLIIRKATETDLNDVAEMRNSEFVLKYNGMSKLNLEQLKEMIVKMIMPFISLSL